MNPVNPSISIHGIRLAVCALLVTALPLQANAQLADVAESPLAKTSNVAVRANLMFIMDDSGSMGADTLPDAGNFSGYCKGYNRINRIFFDPAIKYLPPVKVDGTSFPDSVFTAAKVDGYLAASTVRDLSVLGNLSTPSVLHADATTRRYYYSVPIMPGVTPCSSGSTNSTRWTLLTSLTIAQQTNYANWYSYYRTRMFTMKAAVGRAMSTIDTTRFRVGYSAISSNSYVSDSGFLPIGEFSNPTQKASFFEKLYAAKTVGWTPLRPALEKIGKYYAKMTLSGASLPAGVADPVQYACQRNYAMLSTDGYWNRYDEDKFRTSYQPTRLNGSTAIGNPDSGVSIARPLLDDGRSLSGNWVTGGAGVSNSLADIAQYFYITDLRPGEPGSAGCIGAIDGQDVCQDLVIPSGTDTAKHQHMTTFSLGLGVAGQLTYRNDYETALTGSFADIKSGARPWPNPNVDAPPDASPPERADDLWHAAVNGRGRYYSASNPNELVTSMTAAMDNIASVSGVAAAAATSSLQPVAGDNYMFIGEYTTVLWEGNLRAHTIDPVSGMLSASPIWEANSKLKAQVSDVSDTRNIYFHNGSTNQMASFTGANLTAAGLAANFSNMCVSGANKLSQCAILDAAQQTSANVLDNVVNYVRGRSQFENTTTNAVLPARIFRGRANTPLGDVVNSSPVYVKAPPFKYADAGYEAFKSANRNRAAMVYLAANDGMLHALNADTGAELWAFVPTVVMPTMHRRADENYGNNHRYMVDGTPVVGDVYDAASGQWRTILVGGLNAGGRGYYALDITDPALPVRLWEITNAQEPDLGLTFGNPVITKDKTGEWIVAFTSGYNNTVAGGNGNGHVFVRNAWTGAAIRKLSTFTSGSNPAGTVTSPSNLGKLGPWVESETDNTAKRMYGGDMRGNVWRIDFDDTAGASGFETTRLAELKGPAGDAQPITTVPMLSVVTAAKLPIVTIATGRYLGVSDVGDHKVQSIYSVRDLLDKNNLGNLRSRSDIQQKTFTETTAAGVDSRKLDATTVNWSVKKGWFADFNLSAGERVNVNMAQASGYLGVATNIPAPTACNPGGTSWLYTINVEAGSAPSSMEINALSAGVNMVALPAGVRFMLVDTNGKVHLSESIKPAASGSALTRRSWRELIIGR